MGDDDTARRDRFDAMSQHEWDSLERERLRAENLIRTRVIAELPGITFDPGLTFTGHQELYMELNKSYFRKGSRAPTDQEKREKAARISAGVSAVVASYAPKGEPETEPEPGDNVRNRSIQQAPPGSKHGARFHP